MKTCFLRLSFMCGVCFALPSFAQEDLKSWGFSIGLAMERYNNPYIKKASINGTDRIVTVDEEFKVTPALWSALNWTATVDCKEIVWPVRYVCLDWVKPGWFAGVKLVGQDGAGLDGAAIGVQWAWLRTYAIQKADGTEERQRRASLNVGIGYIVHGTQELAIDIKEGQPLPVHYDDIKYKKSTDHGWMLLITKDVQL